MKYRFTLPIAVLEPALSSMCEQPVYRTHDVTFECETPAEIDCADDGEAARAFVDRALAVARYVVEALEMKSRA